MPVVKETTSTGAAAQRDEEMRELRRTNEELRAMLAKLQEELSLFRVQMASAEANARRDAEVALSAAVRREEIAAAEIAALREAQRLDREAHRRERDALNELILQVVGARVVIPRATVAVPSSKPPSPEMTEVLKLLNESSLTIEQLRATIKELQMELTMLRQRMDANAEQSRQDMRLVREQAREEMRQVREEARQRETFAREDNERLRSALMEERTSFQELLAQSMGFGGPQRPQRQNTEPAPSAAKKQQQQQQLNQSEWPQLQAKQQHQRERPTSERYPVGSGAVADCHLDDEGDQWTVVERKQQRRIATSAAPSSQWQNQGRLLSEQMRQKQQKNANTAQSARSSQPAQQQQQSAHKKLRRTRADVIEVVPKDGKTWLDVYTKVRRALNNDTSAQDMAESIKMGKRTRTNNLRLPLARSADTEQICSRVQELVGEEGVVRAITDMGELLVTHIDPSATEEELKEALDTAASGKTGIASVSMWGRFDGIKTARVRLYSKQAKALSGKSIKLCGCVTREKICIRCGTEGHFSKGCTAELKCAVCGGPHAVGHNTCVQTAQNSL
ncbi:defective chorion-1 protein, FC106 isoform-like [Anopheles funestus]|uniref:defective chorion-1 protein, FC106 isoform-like n=1 Tax=Anopheles funestus TaxID=62324 RepID=UPI0020C746C8|nr:defective chorion-1 protein, FC106 isoform-like [Anopheles funestus]